MDRIVLDQEVRVGREVVLKGPPLEALRFQGGRVGGIVTLTDAGGNDFRGRVLSFSSKEASVLIFSAFPSPTECGLEIVLLQAMPEKERMELIIQKVTELGVSAIIPFKAERSISLQEREKRQKKAHRWQEIAVRAVQQSRRARVPIIEEYRSFREALESCKGEGLKILLWEKGGKSLIEVLSGYSLSPSEKAVPGSTGSPRTDSGALQIDCSAVRPDSFNAPFVLSLSKDERCAQDRLVEGRTTGCGAVSKKGEPIYALVGPEGGFTEEEVKLAQDEGFVPVKLGQRILRTETAAIILVGILQYELGDLG